MLASKKKSFFFKYGLIVWSVWVFVNYFIHHSAYFYAISQAPYLKTIFILVFVSIGAFFLYSKDNFKLRGWKVYVFLLLLLMIVYYSFADEASIFRGSVIKYQFFFLINNIFLHLGTLLIFLCCYAVGIRFLNPFKGVLNVHHNRILGIVIGMALFTFLLMILAALGFLQTWALVPIILLLLIWQRKECWSFIKYVFWNPINTKKVSFWTFAIVMVVLIFTAFNLVGSIKVFPLGFDGVVLYQNITKSLLHSQQLISGGQAYSWSLFTSLGPLIFGSMVFSIFLSHIMGVLCMWAMFHLGRIFLSRSATWIAIVLFYILPAVSFHNFVDEKVDLAFLFVCISIFIFFLKYGDSIQYKFLTKNKTSNWFFSLLGLLLGFAMGIKYLGLLLIIGVVSMIIYQWGGIKAYLSSMLTFLALLFLVKINSFAYISITSIERYMIVGILGFLGIGILVFYYKQFDWTKGFKVIKNIFIIFIATGLSFMPWAIKNVAESGAFSSKNLLYGKVENNLFEHSYSFLADNNIPSKLSNVHKQQVLDYLGKEGAGSDLDEKSFINHYREMKIRNKNKKNITNRKNTGKREEILRYLGYETGLNRYLSAPYDVSVGVNIQNTRGVDIGFLFLLFLPLLVLSFKKKKILSLKNSIGIFTFGMLLLLSWKAAIVSKSSALSVSDYLNRINPKPSKGLQILQEDFYLPFLSLQNSISELTQPIFLVFSNLSFPYILFALILFCMLFAWIAKDNWRNYKLPVKLLLIFILTYGFLWWILGNGIPYYALVVWMLSSLLIAYYYENVALFVSENLTSFIKKWAQVIFSVFLIFYFLVHFSNQSNKLDQMNNIFFEPFIIHFSTHFLTDSDFNNPKTIIPQVAKVLNSDLSKKIYRVGTFMNYHIDNNISRVYEDSQLNLFDKVSKKLQNPDDFLTVLKLNGVKYVVFDLNVASIDQTPEKSLIDKVTRLVKVLNNKKRIRVIMTDNKISKVDPKTNQQKIVYGLAGKTVKKGSMVIFEIL